MIRSIRLVNFESHKDTLLEFSNGLNVLVGPSDAGKSAVFRALRWVVENRPLGDAMVPLFWDGTPEVHITMDDGVIVSKKKGEYTVGPPGDRVLLTGFGTEVPKQVREAVGFDEVNFQDQISLPFLMFDSASERARVLNRVAGLTEIDTTMAAAEADLRKTRNKISSSEERVEELGKQLDKYDDIEERDAAIRVAENRRDTIRSDSIKHDLLINAVVRFREVDIRIERQSQLLKSEPLLKEATQLVEEIEKTRQLCERLHLRVNEIHSRTAAIEREEKECEEIIRRLPEICPTCGQPCQKNHQTRSSRAI